MSAALATRALAALALLLSGPAQAGRYQHDLSASLSAEYDSNPALSAMLPKAIWRVVAAPAYRLSGVSGANQWNAQFGLRLERSTDVALSADRQDPNGSLAWTRQTRTGQFGISGKYEEASTRVTEFQDTGLVSADGSRIAQSLTANWSTEWDERTSLSLNGSYADTAYRGGTLTDYANLSLGATVSQAWSERSQPYLQFSASRYLPASGLGSSDSLSALAGIKLTLSERLNLDLRGGMSDTSGQTDNSGWQGGLTLDYVADPRSGFRLDLGRSSSASGLGGFAETDQISGSWHRALTETSNAGIDLSWRKSQATLSTTTRQVTLWANRELTPAWSLRVSYLYKAREGAGQGEADGHVLALVLSYAHPDFFNL